ncbi:ParA family protein [filamentous cyanobacterium LEGE 11480]|uniref:ParA family protein n=1 Tax=Romeriopsis navalis LEGE 11480 TaxID=2777977 RepID=A0A928VUF2_9CYAN|nr:ParA family protein [Romeriopsis navalis]MBE9032737.1 ParA family protein [Romeriopsis navalis LEGE 11480]
MAKQIIIAIIANAGGVGKTTISTHIAYGLGQKGLSVGLIDLDPQRALDVFCGLPPAQAKESIVEVLAKDFKGKWPMFPAWGHLNIEVCPGHPSMAQIADDLVIRRRGEYTLTDRLTNYPLKHDVVILDCPATLGKICENAIAAATHLLVPIQLEMKSVSGVADLIQWALAIGEDLQLDPAPPILGLVPSLYNHKKAIHRLYLEQLPDVAADLGIPVYPAIRDSAEFKNCSANGEPLQRYRPNHPAAKDFDHIINDVVKLAKKKK